MKVLIPDVDDELYLEYKRLVKNYERSRKRTKMYVMERSRVLFEEVIKQEIKRLRKLS